MQKRLSDAVFENLKELIKAKNAAHESMFKFSWKKLWPFSLIWPQVDYIRIQRFMGEVKEKAILQKQFIQDNLGSSSPEEKEFLNAIPAYVDALGNSCDKIPVSRAGHSCRPRAGRYLACHTLLRMLSLSPLSAVSGAVCQRFAVGYKL